MQDKPEDVVEIAIEESGKLLEAGDVGGAYRALHGVLRYPAVAAPTPLLREAMNALAAVATQLADEEFGALMGRVAKSPDDVEALFQAGFALYEQEQFDVAATLLSRANRLDPKSKDIVMELAVSLESIGRNAEALAALKEFGSEDESTLIQYLVGFNALMTGDLAEPHAQVKKLEALKGDDVEHFRNALRALLARADAVKAELSLEGKALTAWHAVLNECVLLHESPHGYDEPMHGRYAYVADSPELMKEGVLALRDLLERADLSPKAVMMTPERESLILGSLAAKVLELPLLPWNETREAGTLIVTWSLSRIKDAAVVESLAVHRPGEILWAHASNWVKPFGFAPDVTTFLYQQVTHPYTGGALTIDPKTQEPSIAEPDTRPIPELLEEILAAEVEEPSAAAPLVIERLLESVHALPPRQTLGIFRDDGPRAIQRLGGPVSSAQFL